MREALRRSRAERKFFFSDSQHTFVKGTKDSNKAFLKAQVREGIGTMYLFLIVPHLEVLRLVVCEGSNVEVMCQRCHL